MSLAKVEVTPRRVHQVQGGYQVENFVIENYEWEAASKVYPHSTSAFAALGRLTQKDIEKTPMFREAKLEDAHLRELQSHNAEAYNFGWATGPDSIESKTSKGKLYSALHADGKITHEWE